MSKSIWACILPHACWKSPESAQYMLPKQGYWISKPFIMIIYLKIKSYIQYYSAILQHYVQYYSVILYSAIQYYTICNTAKAIYYTTVLHFT